MRHGGRSTATTASSGGLDGVRRRDLVGVMVALTALLVAWAAPVGAQAGAADLRIVKVAVPADMSLAGSFTFTFGIENVGTADATDVTVSMTIPTGTHLLQSYVGATPCGSGTSGVVTCQLAGTLPAGATAAAAAELVNVTLPQGSTVEAVVDVSTAGDANPADNQGAVSYSFTGPPPPSPQLDLALTDLAAEPSPFDPSVVRLTATVTDEGPDLADGIIVIYDLPPGVVAGSAGLAIQTCDNVAGQRIACTYYVNPSPDPRTRTYNPVIVLINVGVPRGTDIAVRVSVAPLGARLATPAPVEIDPADNSREVTWSASADPVPTLPGVDTADLSLTYQPGVAVDPVGGGVLQPIAGTLAVMWTLFSAGPASTTVNGTTIRIRLGPGLEPIDARITGGSGPCPFDPDSRELVCTLIEPLVPGRSWPVAVLVRVIPAVTGPAVLEAAATSHLEDPDPTNNVSLVTLNVQRVATGPALPASGADTAALQRSALVLICIGALAWAVSAASGDRRRTKPHERRHRWACPQRSADQVVELESQGGSFPLDLDPHAG